MAIKGIRPLTKPYVPLGSHPFLLLGRPFPLRASFNCVIVGLGREAFHYRGFGVSLRIRAHAKGVVLSKRRTSAF